MKAESTILLIRLSTYAVPVEKNVFTFLRAESLKKNPGGIPYKCYGVFSYLLGVKVHGFA